MEFIINNFNLILSFITSYIISIGINKITNNKMIEMIMDRGYGAKDGDSDNLINELERPNFRFSQILMYFPYINIIVTTLESITNLNEFNIIFEELKEMNVISKLDNAEKELHDKDYSSSATKRINQNRKEEKINKERYNICKYNFEKDVKNTKGIEDLHKIASSPLYYRYKIQLLEVLKFSILNNINNYNLDNMIISIQNNDYLFLEYYYKIFELQDNFTNEGLANILSFLNILLNDKNVDRFKKVEYFELIHNKLEYYASKNKKGYKLNCNVYINKENFDECTINIKKVKELKNEHIK